MERHRTLNDPDPTPTDGTVVLRRWTVADLGCVRAASEEGRVHEYTSVPERFTEEDGRAWIRRQQKRTRAGQGWSLAIGDARTAEALGCVVLMLRPQVGVAGIGYWLIPEARNRGLATRAVGLLTTWGLGAGGWTGSKRGWNPTTTPPFGSCRDAASSTRAGCAPSSGFRRGARMLWCSRALVTRTRDSLSPTSGLRYPRKSAPCDPLR